MPDLRINLVEVLVGKRKAKPQAPGERQYFIEIRSLIFLEFIAVQIKSDDPVFAERCTPVYRLPNFGENERGVYRLNLVWRPCFNKQDFSLLDDVCNTQAWVRIAEYLAQTLRADERGHAGSDSFAVHGRGHIFFPSAYQIR